MISGRSELGSSREGFEASELQKRIESSQRAADRLIDLIPKDAEKFDRWVQPKFRLEGLIDSEDGSTEKGQVYVTSRPCSKIETLLSRINAPKPEFLLLNPEEVEKQMEEGVRDMLDL